MIPRVALLFLVSAVVVTAQAKNDIDERTIRGLIEQLGDHSFDKREAAQKRLVGIGEPAWDLLRKAAAEASDPETCHRAEVLQHEIGKSLFLQVRRFEGHKGGKQGVTRVAVTPDGRRAVSVASDALRLWDLDTGKQVVLFGERKGPSCWGLAISADGTRAIIGCPGKQLHVFDLATGKKLKSLIGHTAPVRGVALTSDGKQAISGSGDRTIRVWDVDSGKELRAFEGVVEQAFCLTLSPDGKLVAAGHFGGVFQPSKIRLWDFATGKEIRVLQGHKMEVSSVAFSPDGKLLASTSVDRSVRLWDVATGKQLKRLDHPERAEYAAFTPDGKRLVSSGDPANSALRLWDVATGKQLLETEEVPGGLWCVAVLPDGRHCVTGGGDGVVRLWQWKR
jgi:WD40 repeat protein